MRHSDIKRALYEAADIPDPSQTAPPHQAFVLELDPDPDPDPTATPASIEPVAQRIHTSDSGSRPDPATPVRAAPPPASTNLFAWAAFGLIGGLGLASLVLAALIGVLGLAVLL